MELPISTVVSILAILISAGTAIILALRKDANTARENEIDRRLRAMEDSLKRHTEEQYPALDRRLHADEIETERVKGRIALAEQKQAGAEALIESIKGMTSALREVLRLPRGTPFPSGYRGGGDEGKRGG